MNPTPAIYEGRVGHDTHVGFCSCGGFHRPQDGIRAGTKTVAVFNPEHPKQPIVMEWWVGLPEDELEVVGHNET